MKFTPVTATSRDGKEITIRTAQPADAAKLRELKISYIKDSATLPPFLKMSIRITRSRKLR